MAFEFRQLITCLCLFVATMLSTSVKAEWDGNWLVGISGGIADREGNLTYIVNHSVGLTSTLIQKIDDTGFVGGLFGGYQYRCNDWLVGAELNLGWQDLSKEHDGAFTNILGQGDTYSVRYSQTQNVALTGRLGYELFPNLLTYIRLGVQSSRDKVNFSRFNFSTLNRIDLEARHRVYRYTAGAGAEIPVPILMGLSLRAEYNFQSKGHSVGGQTSDPFNLYHVNMRPYINTVLVAIVLNLV